MADAYCLKATAENWEPFAVGEVNGFATTKRLSPGFGAARRSSSRTCMYEALFTQHETIQALGGRMRIEIVDGPTIDVTASFVKGTIGRWTLLEDVEEFFIYS